jgi:hypothetical protein
MWAVRSSVQDTPLIDLSFSYLPSLVLAVLGGKEHDSIKIAATVTAALRWLFSHIVDAAISPALQPAALLLQRIVPYLGYIGSLTAWSWGTIKSCDRGTVVVRGVPGMAEHNMFFV